MKLSNEGIEVLLDFAAEFVGMADEMAQPVYGFFHGGDPRTFSPDPDASTEDERAAHKAACDAWNAGKQEPVPGPHSGFEERDAKTGEVLAAGYLTRSTFGLGVNSDNRLQELCHHVRQILKRRAQETPQPRPEPKGQV